MDDAIIQHIQAFRRPRTALLAERHNRGYTIYDARSGAPVSRLRAAKTRDRFEVLYWSLWKQRWASIDPFGRIILPLEDALQFITHKVIFWPTT